MNRDLTRPIPLPEQQEKPASIAVIALGSNLGDRAGLLDDAVADLRRLPLVDDVRVSPILETVAVTLDGPDASAPAYLNAVALMTTRLDPRILLGMLHGIETAHGRTRSVERRADEPGWENRTLDLDLISYGDTVIDSESILLPHPRAAGRDFVLAPWLELDPDAVLPGYGRVDELLARLREEQAGAGG